jgi:tRNA A-37 threonylcarbamoyl transferase component Bud32
MPFLEINPRFRDLLDQQGLSATSQFLALPGEVRCGHPERHVVRVQLADGPTALTAYLKREHRVPWRDRLVHAWSGEGFISKCRREARILQAARAAGIPCPDVLAAGEDWRNRAFLLLRELPGSVDLRLFLRTQNAASPRRRYRFARALGEMLARVHNARLAHGDLYAKHILVEPRTETISFIDWQRARRERPVRWRRRYLELAALDATLAEELASPRERLACLRAYLRALPPGVTLVALTQVVSRIRREARRFLRKRHVREQRQVPLAPGTQNLLWLDGEALCVTREFWAASRGQLPSWLTPATARAFPAHRVTHQVVSLPKGGEATLVRRWACWPGRWLWTWLRRRRPASPELAQAGVLFRLQRYRVGTPRLVAVGQRQRFPGRMESLLVTAPPPGTIDLSAWLAERSRQPLWTAQRKEQWRLVRDTGRLLRQVHEAGCRGAGLLGRQLRVRPRAPAGPTVVLGGVEGLRTCCRFERTSAWRDVRSFQAALLPALRGRTDTLRFVLAYLGLARLNPTAKRLFRRLAVAPTAASGAEIGWVRPRRAA